MIRWTIFGAGCVVMRAANGDRRPIQERRWRILAIESARLIWKLRCERVIAREGRPFDDREVTNRWYAELERRLALERRLVALTPGKRKAKLAKRVEGVWGPLLHAASDLPPDWVGNSGVLVGIERGR
ncbi:hypothetical protein C2E23DRAFT_728818 [Lenzites betulinus]|nr:hypothetical protein C2E23DRAFT_728818 [Lenzites betulinus]